jgi:hypothetical protein
MPADPPPEQPAPQPVRRAFVVRKGLERASPELQEAYAKGDLGAVSRAIGRLAGLAEPREGGRLPFAVTRLPLRDWRLDLEGDFPEEKKALAQPDPKDADAAFGILCDEEGIARRLSEALRKAFGTSERPGAPGVEVAEGDIPLGAALHWCPGRGEGEDFGTEPDAHRLIRADAISGAEYDGSGVKVVIIDQGVSASRLPPGTTFMGGWWTPGLPLPGQAAPDNTHGTMIARRVLALAPRAMIFDCPIIPPRIGSNLPTFLSDMFGLILRMRIEIGILAAINPARWRGRWVLVNAWSIYDPRGEAVEGEYSHNRYHWLALALDTMTPFADIVFAAGNCGAFCPDRRCAESVIGPGRGIRGVHLLEDVLTVGGVRADGIWVGYSSQGPGRFGHDPRPRLKPDVAAPAQFRVLDSPGLIAGGSSSACGVAAGVVAALRTRWNSTAVAPRALFDRLRDTAWQLDGSTDWSDRTGQGIIDCRAVVKSLAQTHAAPAPAPARATKASAA